MTLNLKNAWHTTNTEKKNIVYLLQSNNDNEKNNKKTNEYYILNNEGETFDIETESYATLTIDAKPQWRCSIVK